MHSDCAEYRHYAQAQNEFLRDRDAIFSAAVPYSGRQPWRLTNLIGVTNEERRIWGKAYRIMMVLFTAVMVYLIWAAISEGREFWDTVGRIALGLTIGGAIAKWGFPYIVGLDHDRYLQGRAFERASVSQAERVGLANLGLAVRDWQQPALLWTPDAPNNGASMFTAIIFGMSFCFLASKIIVALVVAIARTGTPP